MYDALPETVVCIELQKPLCIKYELLLYSLYCIICVRYASVTHMVGIFVRYASLTSTHSAHGQIQMFSTFELKNYEGENTMPFLA